MAVTFDGGVVLGADSRTSTGNYIANRVTDKLTQLTDNVGSSDISTDDTVVLQTACVRGSTYSVRIYMLNDAVPLQVFVCRSGSAADTQAITAYVQYYLHQHQMELNNEILVKTAASFATKMVYSNKASPAAAWHYKKSSMQSPLALSGTTDECDSQLHCKAAELQEGG